jgi:glycosyltransferase involved in cell wall biosynthesis
VSEGVPTLSIGLAVRNGRGSIRRCIESILTQNFTDLELVVSDNDSDDGTIGILEQYARSDLRIKLNVNPLNIGSHENMNLVLRRARGTFFRWISADDWLEPNCLSKCVSALHENPSAIGVTTNFTIHTPTGTARYEEFSGEFPSSPDPAERFERMLWFYHAGDAKFDPIYGVYRRLSLMQTHLLQPSEQTDWLICAELALLGPIVHIHERLANRTRGSPVGIDAAAFRRRLDPVRGEQLRTSPARMYRDLHNIAVSSNLTGAQMHRCRRALRSFWVKETVRVARLRVANVWHRMSRVVAENGHPLFGARS